jgi:hypothetical protein
MFVGNCISVYGLGLTGPAGVDCKEEEVQVCLQVCVRVLVLVLAHAHACACACVCACVRLGGGV